MSADKDKRPFSVFDSKYYVPTGISKGCIEGYPANSDIAKQIGYLDIVKREYGAKSYSNAFLLPAVPHRFCQLLPIDTECKDKLFNI